MLLAGPLTDSVPGRDETFLLKVSHLFWPSSPASLLFTEYLKLFFRGYTDRDVKLNVYFHIVPNCGATPALTPKCLQCVHKDSFNF
jgi:hypothetical protein